MLRSAALVLAIAVASPLAAQKPDDRAAALLQGTWVYMSINSQSAPPGSPELSVTFSGDTYHQTMGGEVNERGTFKVDTSKKPMTIDLAIVEGEDAGKTQLGVFEISGDTLRVHLDTPGANARPPDFKATEGSLLLVAKKKS